MYHYFSLWIKRKFLVFFTLFGVLVVIYLAYIPAIELFFRNDEWTFVNDLEPKLCLESGIFKSLFGFLFDPNQSMKHIQPINLGVFMLKYVLFGTKFPLHFGLSLFFHIFNVLLIYLVGLKISANRRAALMGSVLFSCTAIFSDTIFWPLMFVYNYIVTITLISIVLHPTLNNSRFKNISNIGFYTVTAIAPFTYEFGLITVLIAIAMFVWKREIKFSPIAILTTFLITPIILRAIVGSVTTGVYFVGVPHLILNIFVGTGKLLLGLFGTVFKTKVADTLYILNPDFRNPVTYIATLLTLISLFWLCKFLISPDIPKKIKADCIGFFLISLVPFAMTSFACHPSNPNPDLSHQMPRFYYFPAALMAISLSQAIVFKLKNTKILLTIGIFIIITGTFSIRNYIKILHPHTDSIKEAVTTFKNTGILPPRDHSGVGVDRFKLDWSLTERSIASYLALGKYLIVPELENGYFELWIGNEPVKWQSNSLKTYTKEKSIVHNRQSVIKLSTENSSGRLEQIIKNFTKYRGKTLMLTGYIMRENNATVGITLYDGFSETSSMACEPLGNYEMVTVIKKVPYNATTLQIFLSINAINSTAFFDNIRLRVLDNK